MIIIKKIFITIITYCKVIFCAFGICNMINKKNLPEILKTIQDRSNSSIANKDTYEILIKSIIKISNYKFFIIRKNCLKKSLLIYDMLTRIGVKNLEFKLGINKENGKLDGHSWVTLNGNPYLDNYELAEKYKIIYSSGEINEDI